MNQSSKTKKMVLCALFAAVLCVSAYISIPLPNGSHITFLNFILMIISMIFATYESATIVLIWMLLGIVGIPVFIGGQAGIGYLLGPYGGYNVAFLLVAIIIPLIRGKNYNRIRFTIVSVFGAILVDFVGAMWWMVVGHITLKAAIISGFFTFLPLDLVKAVIAAQIIPAFRKVLEQNQ